MAGEGEVEIRLAAPDEAAVISNLLFEAFDLGRNDYTPASFAIVTPSTDEVAGRFDEGPIWVAVSNDIVMGTVSVVPEPDWLYIRSMAVRPSAQGKGVGRLLLAAVEQYASANGFERLLLYTNRTSAPAIRLYEKSGFRIGRYTTAEEWFGTEGLSMEKEIGGEI